MMLPSLLLALSLSATGQAAPVPDVKAFLGLLESLQPQVEDFRCEYEGTIFHKDRESIKINHLKQDGLAETFSGVFTWKVGGDTVYDAFRRGEPEGKISRDTLIVTGNEARHYLKIEDAPLGEAIVENANVRNPDRDHSLGSIFFIDSIKRYCASGDYDITLEESNWEGHPCSILTFRWKETGRLYERFFIDLKKGGLVFRREGFDNEEDLLSYRTSIDLGRFPVGNTFAWMPIAGLTEGFMSEGSDGKRTYGKEPTFLCKIYVVDGTLEFNRHPPQSTFTPNYKPGTPVTDHLKQLQYEFGQLKPKRFTRAETEAQLREQLAQAEAQKTELVAGSPSRSFDWSSTLVWIFAACALITSIAVIISRRR